jgi:predicted metal-dependent hydrolase
VKPAVADPFPRQIDVRPGRRRSIELSLEGGRFVARIPASSSGPRLEAALGKLREQLWDRLQRESVYTDAALAELATQVVRSHLSDLSLPPWSVRFSRRQHKRWGSCSFDGQMGTIRISAHLMGHPRWVIADVLLHELIHLLVHDHGSRFQRLVQRSPDHDRGRGYLEALETVERVGPRISAALPLEEDAPLQTGLFSPGSPD